MACYVVGQRSLSNIQALGSRSFMQTYIVAVQISDRKMYFQENFRLHFAFYESKVTWT